MTGILQKSSESNSGLWSWLAFGAMSTSGSGDVAWDFPTRSSGNRSEEQPNGVESDVLLDLTTHVPLVDPLVCRTSAVVRVRAVEEDHRTALWYAGPHTDYEKGSGSSLWLVQLEPSAIHEEGRNQRILDFLLAPPTVRGRISSFRVASALPRPDRPWDYQTFWIILDTGYQGLGAKLMVDHPKHSFLIELSDYTVDSTVLPSPPNKQEQQVSQTFWDHLMNDS